ATHARELSQGLKGEPVAVSERGRTSEAWADRVRRGKLAPPAQGVSCRPYRPWPARHALRFFRAYNSRCPGRRPRRPSNPAKIVRGCGGQPGTYRSTGTT